FDRTYVSHVAGKLTAFALPWDGALVASAYERLIHAGIAQPCDLHLFITREPAAIARSLAERAGRRGLGSYDRFLLEQPSAIGQQQELFVRTCGLIGGRLVSNDRSAERFIKELEDLVISALLAAAR